MAFGVEFLEGRHHQRRGVAFLESTDDKWINARAIYEDLKESEQWNLLSRIHKWQSGFPDKKQYHGWNKSEHGGIAQESFVFKLDSYRFYGFLCHPDDGNPRYELCVLVRFLEKRQWKTERSVLKRIKDYAEDKDVLAAIKTRFR